MIIALVGFAKSGKGEVAKWLGQEYDFAEYNFADPLKEAVSDLFGWDLSDMYSQAAKEKVDPLWGITPRQALQFMGTEVMRQQFTTLPGWKVGSDFWVERLRRGLARDQYADWVISDCRFQNEVDLVKGLGGYVYLVQRDAVVPADLSAVHASERPDLLTGIDGVISNNMGLEALKGELFLKFKFDLLNGHWVMPE